MDHTAAEAAVAVAVDMATEAVAEVSVDVAVLAAEAVAVTVEDTVSMVAAVDAEITMETTMIIGIIIMVEEIETEMSVRLLAMAATTIIPMPKSKELSVITITKTTTMPTITETMIMAIITVSVIMDAVAEPMEPALVVVWTMAKCHPLFLCDLYVMYLCFKQISTNPLVTMMEHTKMIMMITIVKKNMMMKMKT